MDRDIQWMCGLRWCSCCRVSGVCRGSNTVRHVTTCTSKRSSIVIVCYVNLLHFGVVNKSKVQG